MNNTDFCTQCGASTKKYWHKLTPGLIKGLIKFRAAINRKQENRVHLLLDMVNDPLTPHEWNNWTKLRFNGLVAKCKKSGKLDRGYWLLTKRGADFLNGTLAVPAEVQTFRNKVVAHSPNLIYVKDVLSVEPYFQSIFDVQFEIADESDFENVPVIKKYHKTRKKVKNPCMRCGGETHIATENPVINEQTKSISVTMARVCKECGFKIYEN